MEWIIMRKIALTAIDIAKCSQVKDILFSSLKFQPIILDYYLVHIDYDFTYNMKVNEY